MGSHTDNSIRTLIPTHYHTQIPEVLDEENRAANPTPRHIELSTENLHIDREANRKEHKKVRFRPYNEIKTYNAHDKHTKSRNTRGSNNRPPNRNIPNRPIDIDIPNRPSDSDN